VAIGVFDGVHVGHKKVLKAVARQAQQEKTKAVALTFDPHPAALGRKRGVPFLMTLQHRLRMIEELGVQACIVLNFNRQFASIGPERFAKKILVDLLAARKVIVGEGFLFGKGRAAGVKQLRDLGKKLGFNVVCIKHAVYKSKPISSTRIRGDIELGCLKDASGMLGRPVSVLGTVAKGDARGRILGFPTANINPHHEAIPPSGVYAVRILFKGRMHKGVLNIGRRPTFYGPQHKDKEPLLEVHIFRFNRTIYKKDIEVRFVEKIRNERKFCNKEKLIVQIERDIKKAQEVLC